MLDELREKKLAFPRQLENITKESVKNNYTSFVTTSNESIAAKCECWNESGGDAEQLQLRKEDFPGLPKASGHATVSKVEVKSNLDDNDKENETILAPDTRAWLLETKKDLFKDAKPAQRPDVNQLAAAIAPGPRALFEAMDEHDPGHPSYNVARYYSDIVELFICPRVRCGYVRLSLCSSILLSGSNILMQKDFQERNRSDEPLAVFIPRRQVVPLPCVFANLQISYGDCFARRVKHCAMPNSGYRQL